MWLWFVSRCSCRGNHAYRVINPHNIRIRSSYALIDIVPCGGFYSIYDCLFTICQIQSSVTQPNEKRVNG